MTLTLAGLTLSTLLFSWYARKLYVKEPNLSQQDKSDMILLAKMVCYSKLFMPANSVLSCKPAPNLLDECQAWDLSMRVLAADVEESVMRFLDKHQPKRNRTRKPYVQGIMKLIQKIKIVEFPVINVVDSTVSSVAKSSCWFYSHISEFRV